MKNPITSLYRTARNFFGGIRQTGLPTQRQNWLGPRFEPDNISAAATSADIQSAIRQAETGDTTSLFRFYRDSLLGDDLIQGELNKRKLAVIGQPTAVLPADKNCEDDIAAAAACLRAIADCENWNAGIGALLGASQWPVSLAENIFRPADDMPVKFDIKGRAALPRRQDAQQRVPTTLNLQFTLKRIEPVNPLLFCFKHAYYVASTTPGGVGMGTATPIQQTQPDDAAEGRTPLPYAIDLNDWEPFLRLWPIDDQGRIIYDASRAAKLDRDRHLVHRGHLLTDQRDNWGGPMRAILFWWLMRGLGRDWFSRFMERYGMPFTVGKTNVQDAESVALLQTAFNLATKVGGLVIAREDQVELQQATVQGGAEGHALWHQTCNDAISRHITGYTSSDKPAGLNSGESSLVAGVRQDIRLFDQRLLAETLEKQLFARFLKFNGLHGRVRVAWGGLSADDAKTFADLLKTAKDAGWEPTDGAIPVIEDKLGIEVRRIGASGGDLNRGDAEARSSGESTQTRNADAPERGSTSRSGNANVADSESPTTTAPLRVTDPRSDSHPTLETFSATQTSVAENLGVPATWLNPLRDFLGELETKAADQTLTDQDLLAFLDRAQARVPELFNDMDVDELARTLEAGMGKTVLDGLRQRLRQKPELAQS